MSENKIPTKRNENRKMIKFIVFNGLIVGGYLPFLIVVLGLPLIAVIAKTKIKDLL
ncbi:MAG: hypothetical protein K5869_00570 [Saccharofermentans sp.]|nr:hypothetical protein [Saccharofermentans sp.]